MSDELPDANNVYATLASPVDLETAEKVLKEEFSDARVWIYRSGYNGAKTLHVRSESADFEGYPKSDCPHPDYFFNGALAGSDAAVVAKVTSVCQTLTQAGLSLSIEAYDSAEELICDIRSQDDAST